MNDFIRCCCAAGKLLLWYLGAVLALGCFACCVAHAQTCTREGCTTVLQFDVQPVDGVIWLSGQKFATHRIETPPLRPGNYSYEAVVKWVRDGKTIEHKVHTPKFQPGQVIKIPVRMPAGEFGEGAIGQIDGINFGLAIDRIPHTAPEMCSLNGVDVPRPIAEQALAAGGLPDDRKNLRFTVIGPKDFTAKVMKDLAEQPDLKDKLAVQTYTEAAWAVKDAGFKGGQQIYLQRPDGKVLWRQEDYATGGPLFETIRKADAEYRAELDPGPNRASPFAGDTVYLIALAAGAVLIFVVKESS